MRVLPRILFLCVAVWANVANSEAAEDRPLVDDQMILLSGLPGDVESDNAYRRRLRVFLDFFESQSVKPENVHILVHDPEHADIPERWRKTADIRIASRANLLELARNSVSGPATVIVWGHGGDLRGQAVFHVAGPRITADDMKAFGAGKFLLFFTGSGDFAQVLKAENRKIFASENATRFTNDPIGIDIILGAWKKQPGLTLDQLARAAGPQIAAWYKERSLARTEEPTLFIATEEPFPVAEMSSSSNPDEAPTSLGETTGRWKSVTKVSPADFPGSDAVILRRNLRYTLGDDPAIDAEIDETTQILTAEGKARGDFAIPFSPPDEDVAFLALEVLTPEGHIETFNADDVLESRSESETAAEKRFSLPGVQPGSVLHVHYRRIWRRFPLPHVFLEIPVGDNVPVLKGAIRVELAKDKPLHYHLAGITGEKPTETSSSYGKIYEWNWTDIAPFRTEILAEPGGEPRLQISTFPDWQSFAEWYRRLIREADAITRKSAPKPLLSRPTKRHRKKR